MKKKIKVLHIVQSPGGVERYIKMLLRYFDKDRFDNILVASYDYHEEEYEGLVSKFENVEMHRKIDLIKDFQTICNLRKIIKKYQPDIVYMHSSKAGADGRIANLGLNNISIYNPHGWAFNMDIGKKKKMLYKIIEKILTPYCTKIIAISEFEKKAAIENGICKSDKICVIFNGVDIEEYKQNKGDYHITRQELGIPDNALVFGTVGRLSRQKAPDTFVNMARLIKNQIPEAYFLFVGSGEEEEQVKDLILDNSLDDCVKITGWVSDPMQYIKLFDVAFLLSRWEGFGLVLAEYMLAEKPIVATNVDAIPDLVIDGYNGLLVKSDHPEEACEAALRIINDSSFREKIIKNGLEIVNTRFDVRRVVKETQNLIRGLLDENSI